MLQCGMTRLRSAARVATTVRIDGAALDDFYALLPFTLTGAQQAAIDDVVRDLGRTTPMSRLIQGDVGSGKTVIAFLAMLTAATNGAQAALMVPTEVLARQHYASFLRFTSQAGIPCHRVCSGHRHSSVCIQFGRVQLQCGGCRGYSGNGVR